MFDELLFLTHPCLHGGESLNHHLIAGDDGRHCQHLVDTVGEHNVEVAGRRDDIAVAGIHDLQLAATDGKAGDEEEKGQGVRARAKHKQGVDGRRREMIIALFLRLGSADLSVCDAPAER